MSEQEKREAFNAGYIAGIKAALIIIEDSQERLVRELRRMPDGKIEEES